MSAEAEAEDEEERQIQKFMDELAARYVSAGFSPDAAQHLAQQDVYRIHDPEKKRLERAARDSRDRFLARVSDILRRSGVEDAEKLILDAEVQTLRGNPERVACVGHHCVVTKAGSSVEMLCPRGLALLRQRDGT